jgi:hypothetical protein
MFASAYIMCYWCEQRPSNKSGLELIVTVQVGRVYYTGVDLLVV